jgi:hypothetical protein
MNPSGAVSQAGTRRQSEQSKSSASCSGRSVRADTTPARLLTAELRFAAPRELSGMQRAVDWTNPGETERTVGRPADSL